MWTKFWLFSLITLNVYLCNSTQLTLQYLQGCKTEAIILSQAVALTLLYPVALPVESIVQNRGINVNKRTVTTHSCSLL